MALNFFWYRLNDIFEMEVKSTEGDFSRREVEIELNSDSESLICSVEEVSVGREVDVFMALGWTITVQFFSTLLEWVPLFQVLYRTCFRTQPILRLNDAEDC